MKFVNQNMDSHIYWGTDSQNVVSFCEKGSSKPWVQQEIFSILCLCRDLNTKITVYHLKREDPRIQMVDGLSKLKDTDNWSIDHKSYNELNSRFGFQMDLFADSKNAKTHRFMSLYYEEGCAGVDAFTCDWNQGMLWICPPVNLLPKVIDRITSSPCKGLLIFPDWPAHFFYCKIFLHANTCRPPFKLIMKFRPYVTQNENATKTPLFGFTKFEFCAVYFDTL